MSVKLCIQPHALLSVCSEVVFEIMCLTWWISCGLVL